MPLAERNKTLLKAFLDTLKEDIANEQRSQGRVASGKSIKELEVQVSDFRGLLLGASYEATLETGRKAGKVPFGFAEIIEDWMRAKGIFQNESISKRGSIAYFIAKKITTSGTLLHREGGQSGVLSKIVTESRIDQFIQTVSLNFEEEVKQEIYKDFNVKA